MEFLDARTPRPTINSGARRAGIHAKGTEANERDERRGLRQSIEQANQAAIHAAQGSPQLRSDIRARGNDHRDETVAQEEETFGQAKVRDNVNKYDPESRERI